MASREKDEMGEHQFWEQFDPDLTSEPGIFTAEDIGLVDIPEGSIDMTLPPQLIEDVRWPKPKRSKGKSW